jgi:two-component system CheB/CheR fusion protein
VLALGAMLDRRQPPVAAGFAAIAALAGLGTIAVLGFRLRAVQRLSAADAREMERLGRDLRRRAAELDALKDLVPVCISFADDPSCEHVTLNTRYAAFLGLGPGDNVARGSRNGAAVSYRIMKDGREVPSGELPLQRAVAQAARVDAQEFDVQVADGRMFTVHMSAVPLFDEQGAVRGSLGALVDITEIKRAKDAIRERDELVRFVVDSIPALVCYVDRELRYRLVNRAYEKWTGRAPEELVGRSVRDVMTPSTLERVDHHLRAVLAGETVHYEMELPFADGRVHNLDVIHVPRMAEGEVSGFASLVRDVTERRRVEDALRESEAQYRASFQLVGVGQAQVDARTGRFVRVNRRLCEITGYSEEELLARTFTDITHPDDRAAERIGLLDLVRGKTDECEIEKRYVRKDGAIAWVQLNVTMIRSADGRPLRTVSVIQDVTARKRVEETVREADHRKDEFLAMLAHELRNPLVPIRNSVRLLRLLDPVHPDLAQARDMIDRQVTHLVRLVDDLLDVSRITRGAITLRRQEVLLDTCIEQAVAQVRALVDAQGQRLTVSSTRDPLWVRADPARLVQVLDNLLTNASKFTPPGGRISLVAETLGEDEVVIRVRDTGVGIAPDMLPHVFDLFVQEAGTIDRSRGGLGIGLTLVKRLVELHGGRVDVHSAGHGEGAEFVVTLPCLPPALPLRAPSHAPAPAATHRLRVLIVEDNADVAMSFKQLLELGGHEVRVARDGVVALEVVESWVPDVALIDVGLPRLDGYELARRLRQRPEFAATALVAVSGYGRDDDKQRAFDAGFDHHFTKPVEIEAVEALFTTLGTGEASESERPARPAS